MNQTMNSFIPPDLAVAPNPFGLASSLILKTIPIDAFTSFELWLPLEGSILIPEEARLLMDDRPRLEEICGKLTWLFGAAVYAHDAIYSQEQYYDWRSLINSMRQAEMRFDAIAVVYHPQAILPTNSEDGMPNAWTVRPSTWQSFFLELNPGDRGYSVKTLPIHLSITYGQPTTKAIASATIGMHYA
jgi:hypothetical protein